jgi:hypothetical protein
MKKQTFGIAILSLTALVMIVAHWTAPQPAIANEAVKDRDYQVVTASTQAAGDALYIADSRTGLVAIFTYDGAAKTMKARAVRALGDAFVTR